MSKSFLTRIVKKNRNTISPIILAILLVLSSTQSVNAYSKPLYSSVVIDVNNGRTIYSRNATSLRYPASLTKIMTLYMLFEELKAGRVKKWTKLPVSRHATYQEPSRLGLKKGQWISVDNAIKALVTKSANDVAVVIAEYIGGTEKRFATLMTKKARSIGMKRTTFKNASGLPNKAQLTTAKDMAILGIRIQSRFPTYYKYFKIRTFKYKGRVYGNHNKLLGKYKGVDGIKTGYTRASGFNLVSSVKRNGKNVIAVVIGGKTAKSRDAHMRQLLDKAIPLLAVKKTVPIQKPKRITVKSAPKPKRPQLPQKMAFPVPPTAIPVITAGKTNRLLAHMTPMPKTLQNLTSADLAFKTHAAAANQNTKQPAMVVAQNTPLATPQLATPQLAMPQDGKVQKDESRINFAAANGNSSLPLGYAPTLNRNGKSNLSPIGQKIIAIASARFIVKKPAATVVATAAITSKKPVDVKKPEPVFKGSWAVQVGAYANPKDAKKHLDQLSNIMSPYDAQYYIPSVKKGNKSFYRARFAGLTKKYARLACKDIKSKGHSCLALKNK